MKNINLTFFNNDKQKPREEFLRVFALVMVYDEWRTKFPWIEHESDFHFLPFPWNKKSLNENLPRLSWFWVNNVLTSAWFHVKWLKLSESGVTRNSQCRTEVKCDFIKCWKLLLILNFPWAWIHWPITKHYHEYL